MEKGEGDGTPDDGIVSEDLTSLVEHIELTSLHRLPEAPDWELATPATDLDDAPILIGEVPDDDPELDSMGVEDDSQLYVETQADLKDANIVAPLVGHAGDGNFHLIIMLNPDDQKEFAAVTRVSGRSGTLPVTTPGRILRLTPK